MREFAHKRTCIWINNAHCSPTYSQVATVGRPGDCCDLFRVPCVDGSALARASLEDLDEGIVAPRCDQRPVRRPCHRIDRRQVSCEDQRVFVIDRRLCRGRRFVGRNDRNRGRH